MPPPNKILPNMHMSAKPGDYMKFLKMVCDGQPCTPIAEVSPEVLRLKKKRAT